MNIKILCSIGAFIGRVNGRNHKLIIEYAKKINSDGFEFLMYNSWYDRIDEILKDLKNSGIKFPVFHADKSIGELISRNEEGDVDLAAQLFRENCIMANELKSDKLVLHLWGGIHSDKNIQINTCQYSVLNEIAKEHQILLTVENVVCNQKNPMLHINNLRIHYPNISFTFDTKMAAFHNELELIYEKESEWLFTENKISHIHINDYCGNYMDWNNLRALHIGEGSIDFIRFFQFLKQENYTGTYTVESTSMNKDGSIDIDKLNKSLLSVYNYVK